MRDYIVNGVAVITQVSIFTNILSISPIIFIICFILQQFTIYLLTISIPRAVPNMIINMITKILQC